MLIGLTGAHRTGKTTLMNAAAEELGIPSVPTSTASVWRELGIDCRKPMSFETRLLAQNLILDRLIEQYDKALSETYSDELLVTDRTPIDCMAYLLAERFEPTIEREKAVLAYRARCALAMHKYFSAVVVVQPGIAINVDEDASDKGLLSRSYIDLLNFMMLGIAHEASAPELRCVVPRDMVELSVRVGVIRQVVEIIERAAPKPRETIH